MDQQTKVGIGAAAGIALMALLEPHFFDSHRALTALIYAALVCVMLWGFGPALLGIFRKTQGGGKRMWPQYLMIASGATFFVGLVAFLQMNVTPQESSSNPEPKKEAVSKPQERPEAEILPDVELAFVHLSRPSVMLSNNTPKVAKQIKWIVVLWNLDNPKVYSNPNDKLGHEPLPIPISMFDF